MKRLLSLILILIPVVGMTATVAGNIINIETPQGVEGISVYLQRVEPNAWENVTFTAETNDQGYFFIDGVELGEYRLSTGYSENYFSSYMEEHINIVDSNQHIAGVELAVQKILTNRGSISGRLIADEMFFENTFYFVTLKHIVNSNLTISMGFEQVDESDSYKFDDLNIGNYKVGLMFYGAYNGEIWYNTQYSEEDAEMVLISAEEPTIGNVNFEINFQSLNQPYLNVEEVIIDDGWDDMLTFGETFNVSYRIKNLGPIASERTSFFSYSPYQQVSMETVTENLSLVPGEEIVLGPYEVSIDYNIEDDFNFHLFYSLSDIFGHNSAPIYLIAYAPEIMISDYEIVSHNGIVVEGNNTISLDISNYGSAHVNYPVVRVSSQEESVLIGEYDQTNYYWLESETGSLEFIFDFEYLGSDYYLEELLFEIEFSSLNTQLSKILEFNLPVQQATPNVDDIDSPNNLTISNYPNPFNPETTINFNLPQDSKVVLDIYNLKGQRVKRLVSDNFVKGNHQVVWKGTNEASQDVTSGVYLYKIMTDKSQIIKKMILQK